MRSLFLWRRESHIPQETPEALVGVAEEEREDGAEEAEVTGEEEVAKEGLTLLVADLRADPKVINISVVFHISWNNHEPYLGLNLRTECWSKASDGRWMTTS